MQELQIIQSKLKVPKDLNNEYAGFKYRSCESILEALKPLLAEHECLLVISDSIEQIGDRYYVKAAVRLYNASQKFVETYAYAREVLEKKGMDAAQITGACSSYARKYALNGLFCIDDTKDADGQDNTKEEPKMPKRAEWNKKLSACKTREDYNEVQKEFTELFGNELWDKPSGHPTKKEETNYQMFMPHLNRVNGNNPIDTTQGPDKLQTEFDSMTSTCQDRDTLLLIEQGLNNNKALQTPENKNILDNLHLAYPE